MRYFLTRRFVSVGCAGYAFAAAREASGKQRSSWVPADTNLFENACTAGDNSTNAVLRCIAFRHELGFDAADFLEQSASPTEEADKAAIEHLNDISRDSTVDLSMLRQGHVLTDHFQRQLLHWQRTGADVARIFALKDGNWDRACRYSEESLGYRYSLEHWLRGVILGMRGTYLVDDVRAADFVYLPHCATGVFMHVTAKDALHPRPRHPGRNSSSQRAAGKTLVYEGNLQPGPVRWTDQTYLMRLLRNLWATVPEYKACDERRDCRFLIVSIYDRHVFRQFAEALGDKAVWVTHAGLSDLLSQHGKRFYNLHVDGGVEVDPYDEGAMACGAACKAHCQVHPPGVLKRDIVLPWVVAFKWTTRSKLVRSRDILAFYSGTGNSCSRERIRQVLENAFNDELRRLFVADSRVGRRQLKDHSATDRILAFPPEFRLAQSDWSELAFRSKLCICPDGDSPNTGRLIEVVMHGCVPLIISNRLQPPLHEYINWPGFSFFLREDSIPHLPRILAWLSSPAGSKAIAEKQRHLAQAAHLLDYNNVGVSSLLMMALRERRREISAT